MSTNDGTLSEIDFVSGADERRELKLLGARGRESISRLFEVDVLLARRSPLTAEEVDALFRAPCAVALRRTPGALVRGILASLRRLDTGDGGETFYVGRVVPSAWLLGLARTNRIFQNMTVPETVASVLAGYGLMPERDYRILVTTKSPKREYIVQYQESDWDFVQRWLEHEGISYWFEHGAKKDCIVFADSNERMTPVHEPCSVSYRARNTLSTGGEDTIWGWEQHQRRIPARVVVFDYNYRTPHVRLVAKATADDRTGFGTVMDYGAHFKNLDEGARIAEIRAELLASGRNTYSATTDCPRFRAGHCFGLVSHPGPAENRQYLITSVEFAVGRPIPADALEPALEAKKGYQARFEAIPLDVQVRPALTTPWPSIHAIMNGQVAADGSGDYAEIDDVGRYKVWLPFDSGNGKGASVSRWIRMAQPHSGQGYGSHHPLHRGTEVLIAHIDGDPDRPVIVGSVPNLHTTSPATRSNATQSVTQTASGIRIEMEDLSVARELAKGAR